MGNLKHLATGYTELACPDLGTRIPVRLEQGGLFLCRSGRADVVIDLKRFRIATGDMVVAFPYSVVQLLERSDDFDGNILAADVDFFASIQISGKSSYYLYVKENPCISLVEEEREQIISLHELWVRKSARTEHPLRKEIDECMAKMIVYEVAAIYIKRKPMAPQPRSGKEKVFGQFIFSLFTNFQAHRTLEFYAAEQSITARHLSAIVKQMSGMTAGEWVVACTVAYIKSKLQNDSLSIAAIADELNFPNPSFFSQYFKKYAGASPKEYRKSFLL